MSRKKWIIIKLPRKAPIRLYHGVNTFTWVNLQHNWTNLNMLSCEQGSPDKLSVVRYVDRVWFSLTCLPCKRPGSGEILTRMSFNLPG